MKLSDKEWRVLNALWVAPEGLALGAVVDALRPDTGWSRRTVLTYLTLMEAKGLVDIRKDGLPPPLPGGGEPETAPRRSAGACWSGLPGLGGQNMVAAFLKDEKLTPQERGRAAEAAGRDGGVSRGQPLSVLAQNPGPCPCGGGALAAKRLFWTSSPPWLYGVVGHSGLRALLPAAHCGAATLVPGGRAVLEAARLQVETPPVLRSHRSLRRNGGAGPGALFPRGLPVPGASPTCSSTSTPPGCSCWPCGFFRSYTRLRAAIRAGPLPRPECAGPGGGRSGAVRPEGPLRVV